MSNVIHFKRRPDTVDLEVIKVRCWRSWFSSQVMPTEIVEALVEEVELLHAKMEKLHENLVQARQHAIAMTTMAQNRDAQLTLEMGRSKELRVALGQTKLDAEIYEAMYDTKLTECKELRVKLGQAEIFDALGSDLHELLRAYVTKLEKQLTNIREAVDWLWGFYDGNSLRAIPGFEDDIHEAWGRLLAAVDI